MKLITLNVVCKWLIAAAVFVQSYSSFYALPLSCTDPCSEFYFVNPPSDTAIYLSIWFPQSIPNPIQLYAFNACDLTNILATSMDSVITGSCSGEFTIRRTYSATNAAGISISYTQNIYVYDNEPPVFVDTPEYLYSDICAGLSNIPGLSARAIDIMDSTVVISYSDNSYYDGCSLYVERTYTAIDDCGNSSSFLQIIGEADAITPYLGSEIQTEFEYRCDEEIPVVTPNVIDNCTNLQLTYRDIFFGEPCNGEIYRVWTAIDNCTNPLILRQYIRIRPADSGCTDSLAYNFDNAAIVDDGSCIPFLSCAISASDSEICPGQEVTLTMESANSIQIQAIEACDSVPFPSSLQEGLMAYYPMCGNARNIVGYLHDGWENGLQDTTDRYGIDGSALYFDGINGEIAFMNREGTLSVFPITLSYWMRSSGDIDGSRLFGHWYCDSGDISIDVNGATNGSTGTFQYNFGVAQEIPLVTYQAFDDNWHHNVFVVDSLGIRIYWDNQLVWQQDLISSSYYPFCIDPSVGLGYRGFLDDIAIFNRGLSSAEVSQLYNPFNTTPSAVWSSGESGASVTVAPSETTTYTVSIVEAGQTCTSEITIEVNPFEMYYEDIDEDGYGNSAVSVLSCEGVPAGYAANALDCDDSDSTISPGIAESCNGADDNCNALIDEGLQPAQPTPVNCWDVFSYNASICQWLNVGIQPIQPNIECWETATFNNTTCSWEVTGEQPAQPSIACWETATFNNATCAWEVTGEQPAQPSVACWETAAFNASTCSWVVTGDQPAQPSIACWETATFNNTTCQWYVTGEQPAQPAALNCWDNYQFNVATCAWENAGSQPEQPVAANCWDEFQFNVASCSWVNIGLPSTFYTDADGDGFGDANSTLQGCVLPSGYSLSNTDCNDLSSSVYPGAAEVCNDADDDCDGGIDEGLDVTFYADADGDGFGNPLDTIVDCQAPVGYVSNANDCDDSNGSVNPIAPEVCGNSLDENCSGEANEGCCPITPSASGAVTNASCAAFANGAVDVTVIANSTTYTVSWSTGSSQEDLIGVFPGTYTIAISDANGCQGSTIFTVGNNNLNTPTPTSINGPYGVCRNSTGNVFTAPAVSGATSYQWTLPTGATGSSTTNSITLSFSSTYATGNLSVRAVGPCGTSAAFSRAVYANTAVPTAPASISGPTTNVCAGSTQTFSCAAVAAAASYQWTAPTNATIMSGQGTQTVSISFAANFAASGSVSVKSQNCFGLSTARTLTVYNIPGTPAAISGAVNNVCGGSVLTYTIAAVPGASSYLWTAPANTTIASGQGTNSISLNIGAAFVSGSLSVRAVSSCGQSAARTLALSKNPVTPSAMVGQTTNLCGGGQFTYSVTAVSGAVSYNWTVPAGCTIVTNNGNSIVLNIPSTFTTGTLTVQAVNSCGGTSTRSASLTRLPATPASITGPASVCPNQTGVIFTTPAVTGVTQLWTAPTGATITAGQSTMSMTCTWGAAAGSVTVKSVNACGQSAALSKAVTLLTCMEEEGGAPVEARMADMSVYPNPNTGQFTIRTTNGGNYQLLNGMGQLIESFTLGGQQPMSKDVQGLSAGVYFIRNVNHGVMERVVVAND